MPNNVAGWVIGFLAVLVTAYQAFAGSRTGARTADREAFEALVAELRAQNAELDEKYEKTTARLEAATARLDTATSELWAMGRYARSVVDDAAAAGVVVRAPVPPPNLSQYLV